jgi:hypothetical protein
MRPAIHKIALTLVCCVACYTVAQGAPEIPEKSKVEALMRQLGDERFSVREQAGKELRGMGEAVADQLRAFLNDPNPEIRARVQGVLDDIASLRKELKWLDPKNLGKREYRSAIQGRAVKLTFKNLSKIPVRIFWIESDGNRKVWRGVLKPGATDVCARSYKGHVWLITDAEKKPLGVYKIDIEDPVLAVREADFKKR